MHIIENGQLIGQEISQINSSMLMKQFKAENEFFLSTDIRLKSSDKSSFQGGKMKKKKLKEKRKMI